MKKIASINLIVMSISCLAWAQGITVTSPNGGETLVLGKPWQITWTAVNVAAKVKIQLVMPGGALKGVIDNNLASGSSPYPWTIGQTKSGMVGAGDYKIRVVTLDGSKYDASDAPFTIAEATPPVLIHERPEPELPPFLKFPRLAVSGIDLAPNADGFGIVFSYKNVGNGALPKASEVPVKPNYRVLIDGKETAHGSLTIPAFPAQPGWEQTAYFGGWIVFPTLSKAQDTRWYIGNSITVYINENKVMGMESHSLTLQLKPIALKYKYDLLYTALSFNWDTHVLTVLLRLDGQIPSGQEILVYCGWIPFSQNYFHVLLDANKHNYSLNKKLVISGNSRSITISLGTFVRDVRTPQVGDMDFRNNEWFNCKFVYPNSNPVI